ncbi:hypothetical protein AGLY_003996 [Aphis glycines]|uniref:Uncharacterized protein n=1 Tax=Aphis glycines TaxID=307491 RepID=A0A6G0TXQ1_APHGL|nr:hypothetical protein AGLY_003996 [Aphis glycines]
MFDNCKSTLISFIFRLMICFKLYVLLTIKIENLHSAIRFNEIKYVSVTKLFLFKFKKLLILKINKTAKNAIIDIISDIYKSFLPQISNFGGAPFFPLIVSFTSFSEGRTVTRFGLLSLNLLLMLINNVFVIQSSCTTSPIHGVIVFISSMASICRFASVSICTFHERKSQVSNIPLLQSENLFYQRDSNDIEAIKYLKTLNLDRIKKSIVRTVSELTWIGLCSSATAADVSIPRIPPLKA